MTFKDHVACLGYGISARWDAVWHHWLKGHKGFRWRCEPSIWIGCTGHICCHECPDTPIEDGKHVGVTLWCRHWPLLGWIMARLCGLIGHPLLQHPRNANGYITKQVYCHRCLWDGKLRAEWPAEERWETEDDDGPRAA